MSGLQSPTVHRWAPASTGRPTDEIHDGWTGWPSLDDEGDGFARGRQRVLLAWNGSGSASVALDRLALWAQGQDAEVWVVHVRTFEASGRSTAHFFRESRGDAYGLVSGAVARLRRDGVAASGFVREADVSHLARIIAATAESIGASFVVVGGRRRGWLRRLFGSTSRALLRHSAVPVLVVPA